MKGGRRGFFVNLFRIKLVNLVVRIRERGVCLEVVLGMVFRRSFVGLITDLRFI